MATGAHAVGVFSVEAEPSGVRLNPYVEILLDPGASLDLESVEKSSDFRSNPDSLDSLGFSAEAVWLRFRLARAAGGPREVLLELAYPLLDEVSLTLLGPDGRRQYEAGDSRPFGERVLPFTHPTFPIELPDQGEVTGLLRLHTSGSLQFPLRLWSPEEHAVHSADGRFLYGLFYGVFLVLSLLALMLFVFTRDGIFLLYAGYVVSYALLQFSLNGLVAEYLWPYGGLLPSRLPPVLTGTSMAFMLLFSSRILGFWPHSRPLRGLYVGFAVLAGLIVLLGSFGPLSWSIHLAAVASVFLLPALLAAAVSSLRRGVWAARYFLIAWGIFLTGVSITGLTLLGLLPSRVMTTNAMQIGASLETWVLSLALFDRMRELRRQKDAAVASAHSYLRQLNEELEALVTERTQALETTNARLRDIANRDSLTGLLNHRTCLEGVAALLEQTRRREESTAVIMLDIDHFKEVNDRFGHQRGDRVLKKVADLLTAHTRSRDVCGRYGGEEFLLAVGGIERTAARRLAERLRREIAGLALAGFEDCSLSASLGVAVTGSGVSTSAEDLIGRADAALYAAKRRGRNRVELERVDYGQTDNVVPFR
jgi:diguanylate cyclase (GGDEF)-like protein